MMRCIDLRFVRSCTLVIGLVTPACAIINDFGESDDTDSASAGPVTTAQDETGEGTLGATSISPTAGSEGESLSDGQTSVITSAGSGSNGMDGVSHDEQIGPIWVANCMLEGCHDADHSVPGLDLESEGVPDRLCEGIHAPSGMSYVDCEGGDPQASYLFRKLEGTHTEVPGGNGVTMPLLGSLSLEELELIETWIIEGALP